MSRTVSWSVLLVVAWSASAMAQLSPAASWAVHTANEYQAFPNLTYLTASNYELKLDIYKRRDTTGPQPTLIFIHGGGWVNGTKEQSLMAVMPWFEMGWNVVNVEYRLGKVALAPAAVEDCLCALRYIAAQAKTYDIDTNPPRRDRRIGGRTSCAHYRNDSGKRGPRPAVSRCASPQSRSDHRLVRHR